MLNPMRFGGGRGAGVFKAPSKFLLLWIYFRATPLCVGDFKNNIFTPCVDKTLVMPSRIL